MNNNNSTSISPEKQSLTDAQYDTLVTIACYESWGNPCTRSERGAGKVIEQELFALGLIELICMDIFSLQYAFYRLTPGGFAFFADELTNPEPNDYDWRADTNIYPFDTIVYDAPAFGSSSYDGPNPTNGGEPKPSREDLLRARLAKVNNKFSSSEYRHYNTLLPHEAFNDLVELQALGWVKQLDEYEYIKVGGGDVPGTEAADDALGYGTMRLPRWKEWAANHTPELMTQKVAAFPDVVDALEAALKRIDELSAVRVERDEAQKALIVAKLGRLPTPEENTIGTVENAYMNALLGVTPAPRRAPAAAPAEPTRAEVAADAAAVANRLERKVLQSVIDAGGWIAEDMLAKGKRELMGKRPEWFRRESYAGKPGYALTDAGRAALEGGKS